MNKKYSFTKRYIILLILALVLCCSLIAVSACAKQPQGSTPEHEHKYKLTATTPATCTEKGSITYTCECGDSYTDEIDANGHSLKFADVDGGPEHWQQCENCDYETEKVAHDYKTVLFSEPSSCTQNGYELRKCECGAITRRQLPLLEHVLQYVSNQTQHWQECDNCDYTTTGVTHSYIELVSTVPSSCTVEGSKTTKCVCGEQFVETLPLVAHNFSKVEYDSEGHYTVCSSCNIPNPEVAKQAHQYSEKVVANLTCTQSEVTKFSCDCGYSFTEVTQQAIGHELDKTQITKSTPSGHFYKCDKCDNEVMESHESVDVDCSNGYNREATCYQTGHQDKKCEICQLVYETSIPKTDNHNFADEWTSNGTFHWHACLNGDGKCDAKSDETQHTFVTERQEPTCTDAGFERKACECGAVQSGSNRNLPKIAHDYEETVLTQASCTQSGEVKKVCRVCQDTVIETVAQLKHDWSEWGSDANGHWKICSVCKTVQDSTANHDLRTTETQAATCTVDGYELSVCNACGYVQRKTLSAHHNWYSTDEGRVDPTCTQYGTHVEICSVCGDTQTVVDESLGYADHDIIYHKAKDATDTTDGNINYWQCKVCGKYFSSSNCETELTEDEVFIRAPRTIVIDAVGELYELAMSEFAEEASYDWYQITLTVLESDRSSLLLYDSADDDLYIYAFFNVAIYDLSGIVEDSIVTVRGHLVAIDGDVALFDSQIIEVVDDNDEFVDLIFSISGYTTYVELYFTTYFESEPQIVVMYGGITTLYRYNYLWAGEDKLNLFYKNYIDSVYISRFVINGKSCTMTNGVYRMDVTEDVYIEIEFSQYDTHQVTLETITTEWNAPAIQVDPYLSYQYVGNGNSNGHLEKGSYLRIYLQNAYITRVTIQFEDYNLTLVADNTVKVGTDQSHSNPFSYTLNGITAALNFSKTDQLTYFEYSASASQARILSINIQYATYNS